MNYSAYKNQSGTEKSDLIAGWVAVAIYLVLVVLLFMFVTFSADNENKKSEASSGILINFGNDSPGDGDKVTKEESAESSTPPQNEDKAEAKSSEESEVAEPIADDRAEVAVVKAKPKPKDAKPKEKVKPKTTPKVKPKAEPKPQEVSEVKPVINTNALYKKSTGSGSANSNANTSHGSTAGRTGKTGTEGGQAGNPGAGGTGGKFSLSGRTLIGSLAKPDYDERIEGQIVIEIQVNREGRVIAATYLPKNSNISSRKIIEAVRQAAMKARFNTDNGATFTQVGTITYILKVE